MTKRTIAIQLLFGIAAALFIVFGVQWAASEAPRAREQRREEMIALLTGEAAGARQSFSALLADTRGAGAPAESVASLPAGALRFRNVRHAPSPAHPGLGRVFAPAERLEFEEKDPEAALRKYRSLLEGELDPTERVMALRNAARLGFVLESAAEAIASLEEAVDIADASDAETLLACYELARHRAASVPALLEAIEADRFPGVAPGRRAFLHEELGGDPERVLHLVAAEKLIASDRPDEPLLLPGGTVAWRRPGAEGTVEVALVAETELLAAFLPGIRDGRWAPGTAGDGVALGNPFPARTLGLGETSRAELDALERDRFRSILLAAAVPALFLVAASILVLVLDLRQARLEKRKRDFLWSITHEFKTPIANILLYAETIHAHALADPEGARDFARTIGNEGRRLLEMVQQALNVATGQERSLSKREPFDPAEMIGEIVERLGAGTKGIDVALAPHDGTVTLRATRNLVAAAVTGIVENAIRFAKERVRIELGATGSRVTILVEDDGPGIARSDVKKVFEPFTRLGDTAKAESGGTGLGLTFVRQCVENDGGKVIAGRSSLGGAAFLIEYPET